MYTCEDWVQVFQIAFFDWFERTKVDFLNDLIIRTASIVGKEALICQYILI